MVPDLWNILSPDDMRLIHSKSVELLESPGIYIDHDGFLAAMESLGAAVDHPNRSVSIPPKLTEEAIGAAAQSPCLLKDDLAAVQQFQTARIRQAIKEPFQFRFGGSGLEVLEDDLYTPKPAGYSDIEKMVRFGNGHPRINTIGGPPVQCAFDQHGQEIPPKLRPIAGMAYMAKHCTKLGWNEINNSADVKFAARIGALVAGEETHYKQDPFFLCVKCSISPLKIGRDSADVLWELAQQNLPLGLAPMPLAGGTSPVTPASNLLITSTEILGMIIALYAAGSRDHQEHLALTGVMDMQTGIASFSPSNVVLQDVAAAQLYSSFYGIRCDAATDYIDAKFPGYQSGSERALKIATHLASGVVYPSIGQLKSGLVCSPVQACLDIEAFDWMQHCMRGIEVNEKTLCTNLISEQGIGGQFLTTEHTLDHFRDELFLPKLADRSASQVVDMVEEARGQVDTILAQTPTFSREENLCREIDSLYKVEVASRG